MAQDLSLQAMRPEIVEMLCAHEAFRRLGFAAADIYVHFGRDPQYGQGEQVFVVVQVKEGMFSLRIADAWCSEAVFRPIWAAAVARWDDTAREHEMQQAWDGSKVCAQFVELAAAVRDKGLPLPAVREVFAMMDN